MIAVGPQTAGGVTRLGKTSDRAFDECQPLVQAPAAFHPRGASVSCTHIEIPQVAETYRVVGHSPWWVWGMEHGVNEHGVAVGNHSVFSKEPVEEQEGLIGMDLVRLGLERGRDAREALEVIAGLIESHGQGGASLRPKPNGVGHHNSFLVADPEEAWILETSGRHWAARRSELDAVTNRYILGNDWEIGSRDLSSYARLEGWWGDSERVDVSRAYRNTAIPAQITEGRLRRARVLLDEGREKHDVDSMIRLLRDHGEGGVAPVLDATPSEERFFTICQHSEPVGTTTASMVAALPTDRKAPWPIWFSFGSPCTGVFLPIYLDGVIPPALVTGGRDPVEGSVWWAFWSLGQLAARDFDHHTPMLRDAWAGFEERLELDRRKVEMNARAAAVTGDAEAAAELLTEFMGRTVESVLDCAEGLRARLEG